ncbi:unnamed protein product [Acidocella sp. C78]|nr:unnamed protein product [Acidocella sp. C78]
MPPGISPPRAAKPRPTPGATIRRTALDLAREGSIVILRKGKVVEPDAVRGVIRLAQPAIPPGETA